MRSLSTDLSLFHVFATILLAYLHRVGDTSRPQITVPSHNRGTATLGETMGVLIELFPLAAAVDPADTFLSLARKVARANQERLVHAVTGTSCLAPRSEVVLNYIKGGLGPVADLPTTVSWIHSGWVDPDHALRMQVYDFDGTGEFRLDLDLGEELFGPAESDWAERHLLLLLDAFLSEPEQLVASPALTSPGELRQFVASSTRKTPDAPSGVALTTLFHAHADRTPDAIAVRDGERVLTYGELQDKVRGLAVRLEGLGYGRTGRVGLCVPRSADLVVASLGALEAGATFVPLDPGIPDARARVIAADAGLSRALTTAALSDRVRGWGLEAVPVECRADISSSQPTPGTDATPHNAAYVLYTSGSTGRPKGVVTPRAALDNYVSWARYQYTGGAPTDFALFTSPAFDLTMTSLFVPLTCGGGVVVYGGDATNDAFVVRQVFEEDAVDVVKLTPSHLALVRDLLGGCSRLRTLILGGEDLAVDLARSVHDGLGGTVAIYNEYGPTEATVGCTIHRFDPALDGCGSVPIGSPIDNLQIYVVDEHLHQTPRGVIGEIAIAGAGLARGYVDQEALTRRCFVPNPFRPGDTLYRSGDIGRWSTRNLLEFHGRRDLQVKWRGARIELGEVEAVLSEHPDIRQCAAALVRGTGPGGSIGRCGRCGLESRHPEARLDDGGICAPCRRFEIDRERVAEYFGTMTQLEAILADAAARSDGPHDCLMLFSGGKDSTYALCRLVDMGAHPLVFQLDNGYISDQATENIRRVVETLGLELVVGSTPAMDAIFVDSLNRFSNVCNGCFKTVYTLAMLEARARGIPMIVTGLSRGQLFETRLADLYRRGIVGHGDDDAIDRMILEARKAYHRMDDEVARSLDVEVFADDAVFDAVRFVDFYRYCDVTLEELRDYIGTRTPWIRPHDTGRSTNCRINEVGIFVHTAERGFHNYALPYSWDVRLGHKRRDAAVAELDDRIDVAAVGRTLTHLGYRTTSAVPPGGDATDTRLVAYYVSDRDLAPGALRGFLSARLAPDAVPSVFVRVDRLALTANGKIDRVALQPLVEWRPAAQPYAPPETETELTLADVWAETLGLDRVGIRDNYFELGGDSIRGVQIVHAARARGLRFTPRELFDHPTVAELGSIACASSRRSPDHVPQPATVSDAELREILEEFGE